MNFCSRKLVGVFPRRSATPGVGPLSLSLPMDRESADVFGLLQTDQDPADLYELVALIGTGNFGRVWRGSERATGNLVALKIVPAVDKDEHWKCIVPLQHNRVARQQGRDDVATADCGMDLIGKEFERGLLVEK